jgi:hypothetical protein
MPPGQFPSMILGHAPQDGAARLATCAAIDCLRDGTWFAVVTGTSKAEVVYPTGNDVRAAINL